ncbi:Lrp/AsnC family transcriptional regulator [Agrobacterium larrymoorei]|uniref:Lrp/AsnC family transcriptional regulator n=1 Tax=Agrobacterium larrymoorei TaxID=160699 RepID=A0A4D7E1B0_9HYPH|nr:Lrp/AsnC family transcriptional regulator [Agrobacterium larrymoorei]QCJ01025.1 Lrp/AsnC family transcriptional regulator [Agrobacterium larrymoorei]QYA10360.1 Lrp/AsnC family transcriptional regulator [Agrobacterium larrymoorei]
MMRVIDRADERILSELGRNARIAHADLALRVNLSRNAVRKRIERLERDGLIKGYTILRGAGTQSGVSAALLLVYLHDRMRGGDVVNAIQNMPEVVSCDVVSGEFDLVVRLEAGDADQIRKVWHDISSLTGVRDTLTAFVLALPVRR